jgi:membrane dipeptidase
MKLSDSRALLRRLGVSREALDLCASCDVIDLHVESFVWTRVFRYDIARRHGRGILGACFFSQADLPRIAGAGFSGVVMSVATNPLRARRHRTSAFLRNLSELKAAIGRAGARFAIVADHAGYVRARASGQVAILLGIQGGNALDSSTGDLDLVAGNVVHRITLVHLSNSTIGTTSSPIHRSRSGLSEFGREFVRRMNAKRILVDLAHASPQTFADALEVHDLSLPAIVSHTGVSGVTPHWRNLDDSQVRAIAKTGGVVGILYHAPFLGERLFRGTAAAVAAHVVHAIRVGGDDHVALGSDWDGLIVTPRDMPTVVEWPLLVQRLLERGVHPASIRKVLGANYLRVLRAVRPGAAVQPSTPGS